MLCLIIVELNCVLTLYTGEVESEFAYTTFLDCI